MAFIGVDDTDDRSGKLCGTGRGTGMAARAAARLLAEAGYRPLWVLRHQLARVPEVRTPGNNSAKSITLAVESRVEAERAFSLVVGALRELAHPRSGAAAALYVPGSTPCPEALEVALRIKEGYVPRSLVEETASRCGIRLEVVMGDGGGVVGAFAAAVLASTGSDGRVLDIPSTRIRDYRDVELTVEEILGLGVAEVRTLDGRTLGPHERVYAESLKPAMMGFKPVLLVRREGGRWVAVKPY